MREEVWWVALTATICIHFSLVYNMNNRPFLVMWKYAAGQESLPFQGRVLMAWIFHALAGRAIVTRFSAILPNQLHDPYVAIQLVISALALFGAVLFSRGSITMLTSDRTFGKWAALLVAYMAYFNLPLIYGLSYTLPYDVPSLFFFSGCIYCILRRSYLGFYTLFILGTLNRETICFVTLFYLIWELSLPHSSNSESTVPRVTWVRISLQVAFQGLLWVGIKIYLKHRFASNVYEGAASGFFASHLQYNLREILKPQQWPLLISNFGFTLPLLIYRRNSIGIPGIARACAIILPLWLALMFYVGVIIEIRIYTELIAIVALGVALIVFHRWYRPGSGQTKAIS